MTPPPVSPASMDKVEVIQRSLRCFTLGLFGILPVLGIPFAVMALSNYFQVKRIAGAHWNPAQAAASLKAALIEELDALRSVPVERLLEERLARYTHVGVHLETVGARP